MMSYLLSLVCEYIEQYQLLDFRLVNKEIKNIVDHDVLFLNKIFDEITYDYLYFHAKDEDISFFDLYIRMKQMIFPITDIKNNILHSCRFRINIKYLVKFEMKYGVIDFSFIDENRKLRTYNINISEIKKKENENFTKFKYHKNVCLDFELPSNYNGIWKNEENDLKEIKFVNRYIKFDFINIIRASRYYPFVKLQHEYHDSDEIYIMTMKDNYKILTYRKVHRVEEKWNLSKKLKAILCYLKECIRMKLLKDDNMFGYS